MVLNKFRKDSESKDSGFGSKLDNEGDRLINKNGTINVRKTGLNFLERFSLFHAMITMPLARFILCLFGFYILINLIFAGLYVLCGIDGLSGANQTNGWLSFLDAFFFSTQTLTTVGFGGMYPTSTSINMIASIEAFVGLLSFAMATGILYGRFSRPRAKILFSSKALISPYKDKTGLMIRVANAKDSQLINVEGKVLFSLVDREKTEGMKRKFFSLDLEFEQISLLATSWTIVHPIEEESPLANLTQQDLIDHKVEAILLINAYDETYSQQVYSRTSYKAEDIVLNAKFKSMLGHNSSGQAVVELDKLSSFTELN